MKFQDVKYDDAIKLIIEDKAGISSRLFYQGDHFQKREGWIGPPAKKETLWKEIERGFVSKNVIKEVTKRHREAVVGREPDWNLTPIEERDADEDGNVLSAEELQLVDYLIEWWDSRKVLKKLQDAVTSLLVEGRGYLRIFVPKEFVEQANGTINTNQNLQDALDLIYLMVPEPSQAVVYIDPNSQAEIGVFTFEEKNDKDEAVKGAEVTFLSGENTVIRILKDGNTVDDGEFNGPLNRHLSLFEMSAEPLITEQVRKNQALLNMALSMMQRNVVLGGFLERVLINAELPDEMEVGASTINAVVGYVVRDKQGNPITDDSGKPTIATPDFKRFDPVPVQTFTDTVETAYRNILEECHQLHALISGDATASGESRKQAAEDFRQSLETTKAEVDACGRWLIETVVAMAARFANLTGRYDVLRASFEAKINLKATSEEINTMRDLVKDKVAARARLQMLFGVDDPDAEDAAILADEEKLEPIKKVQLQRQEIGLARDKRFTDGGIGNRIDEGTQDATQTTQ